MLSRVSEYALKSLTTMVRSPDTEFFGAKDLAVQWDLSPTYLIKVLQKLVRTGHLKSITGPNGGFALTETALNSPLIEIIDALEEGQKLETCYLGWNQCGDENPCPFHDLVKDFRFKLRDYCNKTDIRSMTLKSWPLNTGL